MLDHFFQILRFDLCQVDGKALFLDGVIGRVNIWDPASLAW